MAKDVRVVIEHHNELRNFVWASFQDDGSISFGFSDRSFLIPGFVEELVLGDAVHRSQVDLVADHGVRAVTNPHFTFHPPGYVHLRANCQDELFAGLLMIDLMVEQDGRFPWIRFISNPVDTLAPFQGARGDTQLIRLAAPSGQCSIELAVDFVRPGAPSRGQVGDFEIILEWRNRALRLFAHHQPGRTSTLSWNHES